MIYALLAIFAAMAVSFAFGFALRGIAAGILQGNDDTQDDEQDGAQVRRGCENCMYEFYSLDTEPCCNCFNFNEWKEDFDT